MGPMDILLLALLLLWAVLALRYTCRNKCGKCSNCSNCRNCSSCHCVQSRRSGESLRRGESRRSVRVRRENPGESAPLPFAKSGNRTES